MKKVIIISVLLFSGLGFSQDLFEPAAEKLKVHALRTTEAIKIDGRLNETDWERAVPITDFLQIEPNQGAAASHVTVVKVLYNEESLFIGAFCKDPEGTDALRVPGMTRDYAFRQNDTFAVGLDGFLDERNSITMAVNPYGAQKDYLSYDDTFFDYEWNGLWKVRTQRTEEGWYAEFEIPWKTLKYKVQQGGSQQWGINFVRMHRKYNEISAWAPYPRSFGFNRSEYFGLLTDFEAPKPKTNIQVNPFFVTDYRKSEPTGGTITEDTEYKVGGDVRWAINSTTMLNATYNTDFAQADADIQVNNISRFSVFFPEKRQFFLENASLFGAGLYTDSGTSGNMIIAPFFSRRIGLDEQGRQMPIDFGLRLVHQSSSSNYGLMGIKEGSTATQEERYNLVARYSGNIGKQNRLGTLFTLRHDNGETNMLGGIDGFMRLDKASSFGFMLLGTLDGETDDKGVGGYVQYRYDTNWLNAWWTESYLSEKFDPSLGFISRRNVIATTPGAILNYRGKYLPWKKKIRAYRPRVLTNWYHQESTGVLAEREFSISPVWLEGQDGSVWSFSSKFIRQNVQDVFSLLGREIAAGTYDYNRWNVEFGTDPSAKVALKSAFEFGDFYDGTLQSWNTTVTVTPIPNIFLSAAFNENRFKDLGLMQEDGSVQLFTVQGKFYVNPRLSLTGLYQGNSQYNSDFFNLRFSWEYSPLSYVHLVFNSNTNDLVKEQQAIVKLSYLRQF